MDITRNDRVRMERAHVLSWPALRTAEIDGWLWRSSGGGSQRANSVSTIDFTGDDVEAAIREVEGRYRAEGAPPLFQTFDATSPSGLASCYGSAGIKKPIQPVRCSNGSDTLRLPIGSRSAICPLPRGAMSIWGRSPRTGGWSTGRSLERIPSPRAFFGCRIGDDIVATGLAVVGFGCAVVECVTTRADMRRQGAAQAVLAALETWAAQQNADWIGLQVATSNVPAAALYRRLGFVIGATNRFWVG